MTTTAAVSERYCPTCEKSFAETRRCPDDGTELVVLGSDLDPLLGRNLNDRYTIDARLGAGGMGTVYRGTQHSVGREVAIKVVNPRLVHDPDAIKRFLREAKLASRLAHPNAVAVLDFGQTEDGLFFLVMELLVGRTLDTVLREDGRLPLKRAAQIIGQVCEALDGAHRLDIVHRDLKPANVMLLDGQRDLVKVLDFGLAKSLSVDTTQTTMTNSGALLGTPAYMSPEAALGREVDARCDLYSLGVMLYVLASGRLPFVSEHVHELVSMQATQVPAPPPGVPAPVAAVILKLLEKDPNDRYASALTTRDALDAAVAAARVPTPLSADVTLPPGVTAPVPVGVPVPLDNTTIDTAPGSARLPDPPRRAVAAALDARAAASPLPRRSFAKTLAIVVVIAFIAMVALRKLSRHNRTDSRRRPIEDHLVVPIDGPAGDAPDTTVRDATIDAPTATANVPSDGARSRPRVISPRPDAAVENSDTNPKPPW